MLARLRFDVAQTLGRRYPEPEHSYRNPFQRDRDRVVHARAFRRLEAKTQVFTPGVCDHFRNRLTHTIEVSQIARTVAGVLKLDEDLTEALALAHDIGHPPFAHAGEEVLDERMRRFGEAFEHNLHALRIVESFERRYARFPGLNLTFEVREGIIKHSRDYERGERAEAEEYLPGLRPPLEAQLIDLADELAYNTADLDDGFSARMFESEDIAGAVPLYREIHEAGETQFPGATARERFQECLRQLIDELVSGLIEGAVAEATAAGVENADDVRRHPTRIASFTPATAQANRDLKRFLHARVYSAPDLARDRSHSMLVLSELFDFLMANPGHLPEARHDFGRAQPLHRQVCDYLAGMTDGFCIRMHQQWLTGQPV
jgi:dGTPase